MVPAGHDAGRPDQKVVLEGDAATATAPGSPSSRAAGTDRAQRRRRSRSSTSTEASLNDRPPRRVAVVGSGVAGLTAAYVASRTAQVTLYEADDRLGGHADTHVVRDGRRELAIDTGFIVHNERTYPTLLRLFAELGVATQPSEMSLSVRDDETGLEWAGALGRRGSSRPPQPARPALPADAHRDPAVPPPRAPAAVAMPDAGRPTRR